MRILVFIFAILLPAYALAGECKSGKSEEFATFFTRFADDKAFAISRTLWPLTAIQWEFGVDAVGNDVPTPARTLVSKEQDANAPSLSTYINQNRLDTKVQSLSNKTAVVEVLKPNTDWLMTYHFLRHGNCWFLYEFQNHSL